MKADSEYAYEDAAERATVSGWVCKTCKRFWPDDGNDGRPHGSEYMARWCCASSLPCGCGGRITGPYTCCEACRARHDEERWARAPEAEWDGETPLCEWDNDRFFWDADEVEDYLSDEAGALAEGDPPRRLEGLRLVLCEPGRPREFEMADLLADDLPEGCDLPDTKGIDRAVNDWIRDNAPKTWYPTNRRVSLASLRRFVGEPAPAELPAAPAPDETATHDVP